MKSLKIVATMACVALVALACSASASADRLCKTKEAPCGFGNLWKLETDFEATIRSGTEFTFKASGGTVGLFTCTGSTRVDELTSNEGSGGAPIVVTPTQESFSGCKIPGLISCTFTTSSLPESAKWHASEGITGNGYADLGSTAGSITTSCSGLICKWTYLEQISHTYEGGSPAIEYLKAKYFRSGGPVQCGKEIVVEGEREIVKPNSNPIYWTKS